jgi:cation diffusion facilitator CzcD-associated flavoprotein CzcO
MSAAVRSHPSGSRRRQALIIGAVLGGIAAAIELRRHGIADVRILEKGEGLGGTWLYNTYPGADCDVPSRLHSYSFEKRLNWSRLCSTQPEILAYLHEVSRAHGIDELITANTAVTSCAWDEERCRWTATTERGERHEADILIVATGQLDQPARPAIEGVERFRGHSFWATGFRTNDFMFPMEITGVGGARLHQRWSGGAHAHLGMCVPDFPSMFVMFGPNTNTSGGSIIVYLEAQASYLRQAAEQLARRDAGAIDVRPEVEAASDRALQARFAGTAWTECDSWYRDERGRIIANWPGYMREVSRADRTAGTRGLQVRATPGPRARAERIAREGRSCTTT